jgi:hypothetical protein
VSSDQDPEDDYQTVIGRKAVPDPDGAPPPPAADEAAAAPAPGADAAAPPPADPGQPPGAAPAGHHYTPEGTLAEGLPAIPDPAEAPAEEQAFDGYVTYNLPAAEQGGPVPAAAAAPEQQGYYEAPPPMPAPPPPMLETPSLPTYKDDDDEQRDRRTPPRGLIVLVVLVLLLAAGVAGVFFLTRDDEKPKTVASATGDEVAVEEPAESEPEPEPSASEPPASSAEEQPASTEEEPQQQPAGGVRPWARQVIGIVRRSAPGRQASIRAAGAFARCDFSDAAFADAQQAISIRRAMLTALAKVKPPSPATRRAQTLLVQSVRRSIAANRARVAAARAESAASPTGSCTSGQPNASDRAASQAKARFVAAFTPLARGAGVQPVKAADL